MSINHQIRYIKGKPILKKDLLNWSEEKFLQFLLFVDHFVNKTSDPDNHYFDIVLVKIAAAEEQAKDNPHWKEFLARIQDKRDQTTKQFTYKIMSLTRVVVSFIKQNPYVLTDQMKVIMESNQRLRWGLQAFKAKTTEIGAEVVELDDVEDTNPSRLNAQYSQTGIETPQVMYQQALYNMASILNRLTRGIKNSDITSMDAKERIKLAATLAPQLVKSITRPTNIGTFKQIVINKAGKEDMEKALADYTELQNEE